MKVYHGSLTNVKNPNLDRTNFQTDFGRGFYTTTSLLQAKRWTKIKLERAIKEGNNDDNLKRFISVFEYTYNPKMKILNFNTATSQWLDFILKNRMSNTLLHDFDIVSGPVANDNLFTTLIGYETDVYDTEETIKRLKTYKLADQISFHTNESLECLKYIETIEVDENE